VGGAGVSAYGRKRARRVTRQPTADEVRRLIDRRDGDAQLVDECTVEGVGLAGELRVAAEGHDLVDDVEQQTAAAAAAFDAAFDAAAVAFDAATELGDRAAIDATGAEYWRLRRLASGRYGGLG
jgi:hypothetical protein